MPSKPDRFGTFEGNPERSQARIRDLAEQACRSLSVEHLNMLSFIMAVHIDGELGQVNSRSKLVRLELDSEVAQMKKTWRSLEGG
jgi:hypothetical protein